METPHGCCPNLTTLEIFLASTVRETDRQRLESKKLSYLDDTIDIEEPHYLYMFALPIAAQYAVDSSNHLLK
jgi:hypothetical protein